MASLDAVRAMSYEGPRGTMAGNAQAPFHILLVEDEPVIRELVRSMLSDGSVDVVCARPTGWKG